jgi:hypothetical protein
MRSTRSATFQLVRMVCQVLRVKLDPGIEYVAKWVRCLSVVGSLSDRI